jgi:hypothetical protein
MADSIRVTNLPNPGSHEAVALELWKILRPGTDDANEQLAFFVTCREAAYGKRPDAKR